MQKAMNRLPILKSEAESSLKDGKLGQSQSEKLDRLAAVAIQVGLGLGRGQELVMTAPLEAVPLVRRITEHAYRAGAALVTTLLTDDASTLLRFAYAPEESFDKAPEWLQNGLAAAYRSGAARLAITGSDPALLVQEDANKVARLNVANSKAMRPALELITKHEINWTIVACATPAWARLVFPNQPDDRAVEQLWDAIFSTTRIDVADPIAEWRVHDAELRKRADILNTKRYRALHFRGPGTDLKVGLADDHLWLGGGTTAGNGLYCIPNMPTEEVFTMPHKDRIDGIVTSSKPLSYQGTLIEGIVVRFERGRIVEASAKKG
jgi:aminopeptidase